MKRVAENLISCLACALLFAALPLVLLSQTRPPMPPAPTIPVPVLTTGENTEKSIKVDAAVNLSLCVSTGTVKVNGWDRNEVRVFIDEGSKFSFVIRDKAAQSGNPNWIKVVRAESKLAYNYTNDCVTGGDIEIDMPRTGSISISGKETTSRVDSIRKAEIKTVGGAISLRNISGGIAAVSNEGDVTVESSKGSMKLESTTGNIVVFDVAPIEIGDLFIAKTHGGMIALQDLTHRQVDVGSISGSVAYNGVIRNGGAYNLNTLKGSIRMSIPANSSCYLSATYGSGMFETEIPLDVKTEDKQAGPLKTIVGTFGKGGDARIKLTTNNGSINIKKQ
jgi:hypothetical protein